MGREYQQKFIPKQRFIVILLIILLLVLSSAKEIQAKRIKIEKTPTTLILENNQSNTIIDLKKTDENKDSKNSKKTLNFFSIIPKKLKKTKEIQNSEPAKSILNSEEPASSTFEGRTGIYNVYSSADCTNKTSSIDYYGENAIYAADRDENTMWRTCSMPPEWIEFYLGSNYDINKIVLINAMPGYTTDYEIYMGNSQDSMDKVDFFSVEKSLPDKAKIERIYSEKKVKYLRIKVANGNSWVGIYEVEIYGNRSQEGIGLCTCKQNEICVNGLCKPLQEEESCILPHYPFLNDNDTGLFNLGENQIGLITGGKNGVIIDSKGRIGIGTGTPNSLLSIGEDSDISQTNHNYIVNIRPKPIIAAPAESKTYTGIASIIYVNPANGNNGHYYGAETAVSTTPENTVYTEELLGEKTTANHKGSGTINWLNGAQNLAWVNANGKVNHGIGSYNSFWGNAAGNTIDAYGTWTNIRNGLGTIKNSYATFAQIRNYGGRIENAYNYYSTITNNAGIIEKLYQIYLKNPESTGVIGNNYGIYIEEQTTGVENYQIYSEGGVNYFGGKIGIGTNKPTNALQVEGTATISQGVETSYISLSSKTRNEIQEITQNKTDKETIMFWNTETRQLEFYNIEKDEFYNSVGELIEK